MNTARRPLRVSSLIVASLFLPLLTGARNGCEPMSDIPIDTTPDAASMSDVIATDTRVSDAATATDTSSTSDTTPGDDAASSDAAVDPSVPNPPSGTVLCGHGTFTATDAQTTCESAAVDLFDATPATDGGAIERHCTSMNIAGGQWQVWCSTDWLYMWARFDRPVPNGTVSSCSDHDLDVLAGWTDVYNAVAMEGAEQGAATPDEVAIDTMGHVAYTAGLTGSAALQMVVVSHTYPGSAFTNFDFGADTSTRGQGHLWAGESLPFDCTSFGSARTSPFAAVAVSWDVTTGG